ncbi:MAG: rhomboid family intramembrane serine protease [Gemmatimonadaceae bacterium]
MTPVVRILLALNVGIFLLQNAVPGITSEFGFIPAQILQRPWTLFTYMFLHADFRHILYNMIALFFFGPRIEAFIGTNKFVALYLIAGLSGALLSIFFTPYANIIGASGAVFGVEFAFAKFWPREKIFIWGIFPIEARWLIVAAIGFSLFGGFSGGGNIAHFAHLGGIVGAYAYLKYVELRAPVKQWQKKVKGPPPSTVPLGDWKRVDLDKVHEANRDEVNRILDKISAQGVGSLSSQERTFLQHFVPTDSTPPVQ